MLVELDGLAQGRVLPRSIKQGFLVVSVTLAYRFNDGARVDPLVDVQGDGRDRERGPLRLARPAQMRV